MAAAGQIEIRETDDEAIHEMAFPYPFMRFVPRLQGPHGALPDHVMLSSTSAARNGKFFTIADVCEAITESLNLRHEGPPQASCDFRVNRLTSIKRLTEPGTIWDLTPPERDPVPTMPRMVACREKVFASAMGLHPRLGAQVSPQRRSPLRAGDFAHACDPPLRAPFTRAVAQDQTGPGLCKIAPDTSPPQADMNVLDAETLRRIGETVLRSEAEAARASIPLFCTTWQCARNHDDVVVV